jgi:hypothetical protein
MHWFQILISKMISLLTGGSGQYSMLVYGCAAGTTTVSLSVLVTNEIVLTLASCQVLLARKPDRVLGVYTFTRHIWSHGTLVFGTMAARLRTS